MAVTASPGARPARSAGEPGTTASTVRASPAPASAAPRCRSNPSASSSEAISGGKASTGHEKGSAPPPCMEASSARTAAASSSGEGVPAAGARGGAVAPGVASGVG